MQPRLIVPPQLISRPTIETREQRLAREANAVQEYYLQEALKASQEPLLSDAEQRNKVAQIVEMRNEAVRKPNATLEEAQNRVQNIDAKGNSALARAWGAVKHVVPQAIWAVAIPSMLAGAQGFADGGLAGAKSRAGNEALRRAWLQYAPPTLQNAVRFGDAPLSEAAENWKDSYQIPLNFGANLVSKLNRTLKETVEDIGLMPGNSGQNRRIAPELQQKQLNFVTSSSAAPATKIGGVLLSAYRRTLDELIREMPNTVFGASIDKNYLRNAADTELLNAFGPKATSFAESLRRIGHPSVIIRPNLTGRNDLRQLPNIPIPPNPPQREGANPPKIGFEPITQANIPRVVIPLEVPQQSQQQPQQQPQQQSQQQSQQQPQQQSQSDVVAQLDRVLENAQKSFDLAYAPLKTAKTAYLDQEMKMLNDLGQWANAIKQNPLNADIEYIRSINPNAAVLRTGVGDLRAMFADFDAAGQKYGELKRSKADDSAETARSRLFNASWDKYKYNQFGDRLTPEESTAYDQAARDYYDSAAGKLKGDEEDIDQAYGILKGLFRPDQTLADDPTSWKFLLNSAKISEQRRSDEAAGKQPSSVYNTEREQAKNEWQKSVKALDDYVSGLNMPDFRKQAEFEVVGRTAKMKKLQDAKGPQKQNGYDWPAAKALVGYQGRMNDLDSNNLLTTLELIANGQYATQQKRFEAYTQYANQFRDYAKYITKPDSVFASLIKYATSADKARLNAAKYSDTAPADKYYDDSGMKTYYTQFGTELQNAVQTLREKREKYTADADKYYQGGVFQVQSDPNNPTYKNLKQMQADLKAKYDASESDDTMLILRQLRQQLDPRGTLNEQAPLNEQDTEHPWIDRFWNWGGATLILAPLTAAVVKSRANELRAQRPQINPANIINVQKPRNALMSLDRLNPQSSQADKLAALETYLYDPEVRVSEGWHLPQLNWPFDNLFGARNPPSAEEIQYSDVETPAELTEPLTQTWHSSVRNPTPVQPNLGTELREIKDAPEEDIKKEDEKEVKIQSQPNVKQPIDQSFENIIDDEPDLYPRKPVTQSLKERTGNYPSAQNVPPVEKRQNPGFLARWFGFGANKPRNDSEVEMEEVLLDNPPRKQRPADPEALVVRQPEPPQPGMFRSGLNYLGGIGQGIGNRLRTGADAFNQYLANPTEIRLPESVRQAGQQAGQIVLNNLSNTRNNLTTDALNFGQRAINNAIDTGANASRNYFTGALGSALGGVGNLARAGINTAFSYVPYGSTLQSLASPYYDQFIGDSQNQLQNFFGGRINDRINNARNTLVEEVDEYRRGANRRNRRLFSKN